MKKIRNGYDFTNKIFFNRFYFSRQRSYVNYVLQTSHFNFWFRFHGYGLGVSSSDMYNPWYLKDKIVIFKLLFEILKPMPLPEPPTLD